MARQIGFQAAPTAISGSEPLRVLLLEDDPLIALDLETFLRDLGAEVVIAAGATEPALRVALTTPLDAALLDIQVGDGFGGIDLGRQLKTLGIAIIFISGFVGLLQERPEARDLHPYAWFGKPFQPRALAKTLRRLAAERGKRLGGTAAE
jgi:DNA-binding response OmpR family regulator